ncbi:MAG: hypothetical protein ACUVSY_19190 [Roseiflexus sp.]
MLLILDFSGVLSLEAVFFGMPDRLEQALRQSGLWELGVDVARYWSDIVNPTWDVASTTRTPYAHMIAQHIQASHIPFDDLLHRAEWFVQAYMQASIIDPAWRSLFDALQSTKRVVPLIATDHYAEATTHIAQQMAGMGWHTAALRIDASGRVLTGEVAPTPLPSHTLALANSSDLGAHKEQALFWSRVRVGLAFEPKQILVIDDFGANENTLDFYADLARVNRRQAQTLAAISSAFGAPTHTLPFIIERPSTDTEALRAAYRAQAEQTIRRVMEMMRTSSSDGY